MNRILKIAISMFVCAGWVVTIQAQDEVDVVAQETAVGETISGEFAKRYLLRVPQINTLSIYNTMLSSEDGNYLAQNPVELQTYTDLGLAYQYIAEDYLRRQLGLKADQGIIITNATASGEGYKNGFRSGDIVLQVDDESVDTQYDLVIALSENRGQQRRASIRRDGQHLDLVLVLSESNIQIATRWIIGVYVEEISDVTRNQLGIDGSAAITQLTDDGPALKNGMLEHDIITHINDKLINNLEDLRKIVGSSEGESLSLDVVRMGGRIRLELSPQEVPDALVNKRTDAALANVAAWNYHLPDAANMAHGVYRLGLVPLEGKSESTDDRLNRLEASIQRIEELLKSLHGDSDDH